MHQRGHSPNREEHADVDVLEGAGSQCAFPLKSDECAIDDANDAQSSSSPEERSRATRIRNFRMMRVLERIATRFNEAGVPLMVLKGSALQLTLHEDLISRKMADIDLMVRPEDVDRAFHLLEQLGGLRGEPLVRDDFFPRFHYEIEYSIGKIYPVKIDLHVRPFRPLRYSQIIPVDALWERAKTVSVGGANILVPSTDDMLVHLSAHAAVHNFADDKWVADINQWVERHDGDIDWDQFLSTVQAWRLALPVREAFERVRQELGIDIPPKVSPALSKMRVSWRDRLALWQAPRDAAHPVMHVITNVLCTPGLRFVIAYLWAVLIPDRAHMADWYTRRHWGWLPCAHLLRSLGPISKLTPRLWTWSANIETRKSQTHGTGVFATRDFKAGEVIARFHGRAIDHCGTYVVPVRNSSGKSQRYELTGKLKFLNHSCRPNAELSGFQLIALKPIRTESELKIDYGEGTCDCRTKQDEKVVSSSERTSTGQEVTRDQKRAKQPKAERPGNQKVSSTGDADSALGTRRSFLGGVGKKAIYLTPIVMTLSASPAVASGGLGSCGYEGDACTDNGDCCVGFCNAESMCGCNAMGVPCTRNGECCSSSCGGMTAGVCD